jgi:hypothetical protein
LGIFSVTLTVLLWAFSSDVYNPERGEQLFPLIAESTKSGSGKRRCRQSGFLGWGKWWN